MPQNLLVFIYLPFLSLIFLGFLIYLCNEFLIDDSQTR